MNRDEILSFAELRQALVHGRAWIPAGIGLGLVLALGASYVLPPRYETSASLTLDDPGSMSGGASLAAGLGAASDLVGSLGFGGLAEGSLATEMQILQSDSLLRRVLRDEGLHEAGLSREPLSIDEAVLKIRRKNLVEIELLGGEVAQIRVEGRDAQWTQALANGLAERYLTERQERIAARRALRESLADAAADALNAEWQATTDALREAALAQGTFRPDQLGILERVAEMQAALDLAEVEARALRQASQAEGSGLLAQIAGIKALNESQPVTAVADRLLETRASRAALLEQRTERDPEVRALTQAAALLEDELRAMAVAALEQTARTTDELRSEIAAYGETLARRPAEEETLLVIEAELERLAALLAAVEAQRVQSAMTRGTEGSEVRIVDLAVVPIRPAFPSLPLNLALGAVVGLLAGVFMATARGLTTPLALNPTQVQTRLGVPCARLGAGASTPSMVIPGSTQQVALVTVGAPTRATQSAVGNLKEALAPLPVLHLSEGQGVVHGGALAGADPRGTGIVLVLPERGAVLPTARDAIEAFERADLQVIGVLLATSV